MNPGTVEPTPQLPNDAHDESDLATCDTQSSPGPTQTRSADWWTRPATRWIALLFATGIVLYLCWLMLEPFIDVLMWAIVLVVVFYPVHFRIRDRFGSPSLSAAISSLLVIFTILLPLTLITVVVVRDAADVARSIQERKEALLNPGPETLAGRGMHWLEVHAGFDRAGAQQYLADRMRSMSGAIASRTLNIVGGVIGVVVQIFFVIFTMFYLFRDGETLRASLREMLPLDRWASHEVFLRTREVIQASIYGSLVIAAIQGALGGIMFAIVGVPSPLLWAAVMIFTCMIPMVGSALVWVPAALYLLATDHWIRAVVLTAWCLLVVSTVDNVLRPKLVGGRTRLHELVVFFAVLGGIQVFGVLGIIAGPVVAAIAIALFEIWRRSRPLAAAAATASSASGSLTTTTTTASVDPGGKSSA